MCSGIWARRRGERARRRYNGAMDVSHLLDALNPAQREAVSADPGHYLVLAGAGSGKTRVLVHRIAWLTEVLGVPPWGILAVTFTNKAAGEMRDRVAALVGGRARLMWVSTFHSACVRILRAEHEAVGLPSTFTIYDADDSRRLMQLVSRDLDIDQKKFPPRYLLGAVSNLKNELTDADAAAESAKGADQRIVAEAYQLYQRRLREATEAVPSPTAVSERTRPPTESAVWKRRFSTAPVIDGSAPAER